MNPTDNDDHDDLPLDPDWDDVPLELMVSVVIVPGLFGHARRLREAASPDGRDE